MESTASVYVCIGHFIFCSNQFMYLDLVLVGENEN